MPSLSPVGGEQGGGTYPQNPESSGVFRMLVFLKHGLTFRELIWQIDIEKDPRAHRKLMAVHRDYWHFKTGSRFDNFKLKFAYDHFQIIAQGFDFGLAELTPEELGECLDEICPCGRKHSTEYLKKVRSQIKKRALDSNCSLAAKE